MKRYILFCLFIVSLTGCFGQRPQLADLEAERGKIEVLLNDFEDSIARHDCYEAANYKDQLFRTKAFSSDQAKALLLTKLCLCYLEADGNIQLFSACASELREVARELSYLRRETQFVLELESLITNGESSADPRISPEIRDALAIVFQGGE